MKTFLECVKEAASVRRLKDDITRFYFELPQEMIIAIEDAADMYATQSNSHKPVVMQGLELNLPSMGEVSDEIEMLAKKSTAPDAETPDWLKADIRNGINWALNYVTKHNTSPTVGKAGEDASVSDGK